MLAPGSGKTATARLSAYGRDERPWGSGFPPAGWYRFSPERKGQHPEDHLAGCRGWMHTGGHAGFGDIYRSRDIHEVARMARVRRNDQQPTISGTSPLAMAIRYGLTRTKRLRPYPDHGCLDLHNNTAARAMRSVALGRKNDLFVGSQTGGRAAVIAYTPIETAKPNGVDPQGWLAETLARMPDYKITRVDDLLPWNRSHHAA